MSRWKQKVRSEWRSDQSDVSSFKALRFCHVDGVWCCKGPGRKGLFFTVPRGDIWETSMTRFGFPLPACLPLWPVCSAHRKTQPSLTASIFTGPNQSSHPSYTSPLLLPNRFWWFLPSSIKGVFSTSAHISEGSSSGASVHLSATDARRDHLQLPIAHSSCQVSYRYGNHAKRPVDICRAPKKPAWNPGQVAWFRYELCVCAR